MSSTRSERPSLGARLFRSSSSSGTSSFTMPRMSSYSRVDEKDVEDVEDDSPMEDIRTSWRAPPSRNQGLTGWLKWLLLFWNVLLLLVVAVLASQVWKQRDIQECKVFPQPGARVDQWPHTLKPTLFLPNASFATGAMWSSLPLLESVLGNWVPLSPSSRGLIALPQSTHPTHDPPYTLDPLNTGNPQEAYMLSAPHQLHCLSTIMYSYGKVWNGADEMHMAEHIAHCFDYLRQGILCAGDVTVEGNASWRFPDREVEPPWGAEHMCRDWEGVREWADERGVWEFPDGLGIL